MLDSLGETGLEENLAGGLILHVEIDGFTNLVETVTGLYSGFEVGADHSFSSLNNLNDVLRWLSHQEHTQKERFDCLGFTNEVDHLDARGGLIAQEAVEDQGWFETHILKHFTCGVSSDAF